MISLTKNIQGHEFKLDFIHGKVIDVQEGADTYVSGGGSSVRYDPAYGDYVRQQDDVTSTVVKTQKVWIKSKTAGEISYTFRNKNLDVRKGSMVTVATITQGFGQTQYPVLFMNHDLGNYWLLRNGAAIRELYDTHPLRFLGFVAHGILGCIVGGLTAKLVTLGFGDKSDAGVLTLYLATIGYWLYRGGVRINKAGNFDNAVDNFLKKTAIDTLEGKNDLYISSANNNKFADNPISAALKKSSEERLKKIKEIANS